MNYKEVFKRYYDIGEQDVVLCAVCSSVAVDIHHILFRSQGGKDNIENLIPLCRECHNKAHSNKEFNNQLKQIQDEKFGYK